MTYEECFQKKVQWAADEFSEIFEEARYTIGGSKLVEKCVTSVLGKLTPKEILAVYEEVKVRYKDKYPQYFATETTS